MLDKLKALKKNKAVRIIGKISYWALYAITILLLIVVLLQRFSSNTVSLAGFRIFNVITESMVPKYNVSDVLLSKEVSDEELKVGDDVVYIGERLELKDMIITHQIINIKEVNGQKVFTTKGIANETPDPDIYGRQILGKIIYKIESLSLFSRIVTNLYSFYFIVFLPMVLIVFIEIRKAIVPKEEYEAEKKKKGRRSN